MRRLRTTLGLPALALLLLSTACTDTPSGDERAPLGSLRQAVAWISPALVKDLAVQAGSSSSSIADITVAGTKVFFSATSVAYGNELWVTDGTVEGTRLVRDISPGTSSSTPDYLVAIGDKVVFEADDDGFGSEPWVSDGTAAGTFLLKDIFPGYYSSYPADFGSTGTYAVFSADDGVHGTELWKTDGTPAGTVLLKDVIAGIDEPDGIDTPVALGSKLVFGLDDPATGREPWVTDGTPEGTMPLADLKAGTSDGLPSYSAANFFVHGGKLYMAANDPINTSTTYGELAVTDGTPEGTKYLEVNAASYSLPSTPVWVNLNGTLLFVASNGSTGNEWYKTDGTTEGTVLVRDIRSGSSAGISTSYATVGIIGNYAYFAANDGTAVGSELWRTDGSSDGTTLVKDIYLGGTTSSPNSSNPDYLMVVGSTLYFSATTGTTAGSGTGRELYKSDGTADGTVIVRDINAGTGSSSPYYPTAIGDRLYFRASNGSTGDEVWTTDGTSDGTVALGDLNPGTSGCSPNTFMALGGNVFFLATDGSGEEPWIVPGGGTAAPVKLDLNPPSASVFASFGGEQFTVAGTKLFFVATGDGNIGKELFVSDGTETGTMLTKDIYPSSSSTVNNSYPDFLTALNGRVYFAASTGSSAPGTGKELWTSDGTTDGTWLVKDIYAGTSSGSPDEMVESNGLLWFEAAPGSTAGGTELWKSNGTDTGTVIAADTAAGTSSGYAYDMTPFGAGVLYSASANSLGTELYYADNSGFRLIKDIAPGSTGSNPDYFVVVDGVAYFEADNGTANGSEPWRTDGTSDGTWMLKDVNPGADDASPNRFTSAGGRVYFAANDGVHGIELWTSDGTTDGTRLVKDIWPGVGNSYPDYMVDAYGKLFFAATSPAGGRELWKTDGTEAGTVLVKDIVPGAANSNPISLFATGPKVLFAAGDDANGRELWVSDGTSDGTTLVADLWPGTGSSEPGTPAFYGSKIVFSALSPTAGRELFAAPLPADTVAPYVRCPADITINSTVQGPAPVTYRTPYAYDDRPGAVVLGYSLASGANFPLGETEVTVTATDAASNQADCSFRVIRNYVDDVDPVPTCPADQTAETTDLAGLDFTFPAASATDNADAEVAITYSKANGSKFPLGQTTVTATATDDTNNTATCSFKVTITYVDHVAPVVTCPANKTATTNSVSGGAVTYTAATAVDEYTQNPVITYSKASGESFPVGETTVTVTAKDAANNQSQCTFKVTLTFVDITDPTITCPADIAVDTEVAAGKAVTLTGATGTDDSGATPTITYSPASGTNFAVGETQVTATATDAAGNDKTCTFKVVVTLIDITDPVITCPADIAKDATVRAGIEATFAATATDNLDTSVAITYSKDPGTVFPLGETTVTATATDDYTNTATCTFKVTVTLVDTTKPVITCPANVTATANAKAGVAVTYSAATATDNLTESPAITYSKASGETFPVGETSVTATAKDEFDNTESCTFKVTVNLVDIGKPVITCPGDQSAQALEDTGIAVTYPDATATDDIDDTVAITYSKASGSVFPVGDTVVTAVAKDAANNSAECTFTVKVAEPEGCGCAGADPTSALLLLGFGALLRRRRK